MAQTKRHTDAGNKYLSHTLVSRSLLPFLALCFLPLEEGCLRFEVAELRTACASCLKLRAERHYARLSLAFLSLLRFKCCSKNSASNTRLQTGHGVLCGVKPVNSQYVEH